jgi:hypothetical protein
MDVISYNVLHAKGTPQAESAAKRNCHDMPTVQEGI